MYGEDVLNKDKPFIMPRKLSFTLVLSDTKTFKGGDLEFDTGGPYVAAEQKRGRIIAFPSFVKHRVTPIKKGVRKSVVWWVLGPKFK
jgi:PKHD-type hydroxylase